MVDAPGRFSETLMRVSERGTSRKFPPLRDGLLDFVVSSRSSLCLGWPFRKSTEAKETTVAQDHAPQQLFLQHLVTSHETQL